LLVGPVAKAPPLWRSPIRRDSTDLALPLQRALEQDASGRGPYRAVVLLSDGRQTVKAAPDADRLPLPQELAERLKAQGTPLLPVALGAKQDRPTVAVVKVEAPSILLKDAGSTEQVNVVVKALVRVSGVPARVIPVELRGKGGVVLGRRAIDHNGKDQEHALSFPLALPEEGPQRLEVVVPPVPGVADEAQGRRGVEVAVVRDQAEVMV